jgi:hypothetical protein
MKRIFKAYEPKVGVLSGELAQPLLAERLRDVIGRKVEAASHVAGLSFATAYPAEGLKTLGREVLRPGLGVNSLYTLGEC